MKIMRFLPGILIPKVRMKKTAQLNAGLFLRIVFFPSEVRQQKEWPDPNAKNPYQKGSAVWFFRTFSDYED